MFSEKNIIKSDDFQHCKVDNISSITDRYIEILVENQLKNLKIIIYSFISFTSTENLNAVFKK